MCDKLHPIEIVMSGSGILVSNLEYHAPEAVLLKSFAVSAWLIS